MSVDKEWNLNSGEPELFKYFGRWEKRKENPISNPEVVLYKKEDVVNSEPENIGSILLRELHKYHNIQSGFFINKAQDIFINIDGVKVDCQLLVITTPWNNIKRFVAYSPKTQEGFQQFLFKMKGKIQLGKQGTPQNPEPLWSWNTLKPEGIDEIEKLGPPVLVEYSGNQYFDYLSNFFKLETTKLK